jgi:alpha-aminoadipate carrier protein LysW
VEEHGREIRVAIAAVCRITVIFREELPMVKCPVCDGAIDVDEEDVDEGDTVSCDECGADLRVTGVDPVELESAEDLDDAEDEDDLLADEEEEEEDDWK